MEVFGVILLGLVTPKTPGKMGEGGLWYVFGQEKNTESDSRCKLFHACLYMRWL